MVGVASLWLEATALIREDESSIIFDEVTGVVKVVFLSFSFNEALGMLSFPFVEAED